MDETLPLEDMEVVGCPIRMSTMSRCGRPIYTAPAGIDERGVCLMHSLDPNKDQIAFQMEIQQILERALSGVADFSHFVFPTANYSGQMFAAKCYFMWTRFSQQANFSKVCFVRGCSFFEAAFIEGVDFIDTDFQEGSMFGGAKLSGRTRFRSVRFREGVEFTHATFSDKVDFIAAKFEGDAYFRGATFEDDAKFNGDTFSLEADFRDTNFHQTADFSQVTFSQKAEFSETTFRGTASFTGTRFLSQAIFWKTEFLKTGDKVGVSFSLARFAKPEEVKFYQTSLGQALFHNADISQFDFSNVEWGRRKNGKYMVFDEIVSLDHDAAEALRSRDGSADDRNYSLIAELYHQLKRYYDDRRDHWTAGDFHWGEMEMKRLSSHRRNRVLRWLHRNLGLTAWYKYASEYGESYVRPAAWLGVVLLLFTAILPLAGFQIANAEVSYKKLIELVANGHSAWMEWFSLAGHGLFAAISVMALQRDVIQGLSYPWGRTLALVEVLITSTLIALFLLAVRRQFRR